MKEIKTQFQTVKEILEKRGLVIKQPIDEIIEEIQPYDIDKIEDDTNFKDGQFCYNIESPKEKNAAYVKLDSPLYREENHMFRYFIDGTLRTYYLGEYLEGKTSFPLMAGEIVAAAVLRKSDGRLEVIRDAFKRKILLLLPSSPPIPDDTFNELMKIKTNFGSLNQLLKLEIVAIEKEAETVGGDWRSALRGKGLSEMHQTEHEVANDLNRDEKSWLIIDGSIRKELFLRLPRTIGLAKSFSRNPFFQIGKSTMDIVSLISKLREGERTLTFKQRVSKGGDIKEKIGFWYLRIRTGKGITSPLHGVVKVEMKIEEDFLDTDTLNTVNLISRALLAEKYVTPYPIPRWHTHIYPIFMTETFIKSKLLSSIYFRSLMY